MTAAVSSSIAATYVAPASLVAGPSDTDTAAQSNPASTTTAAPPAASPPNLAPSTVAALVAQQAADSDSAPSASTIGSSAPDQSASGDGSSVNHVQIPQAVLDNMKAFETTSPTAYTDQINQYTATINDTNASDGDRLNAWTSLNGLLYSGTIYQAGNLTDLQTALDATQTSDYAKSLMQLQNQFNTTQVNDVAAARNKGQAAVQGEVDALNSYSDADQQKIFVLFDMNQQYSDVATLKADDQNIANIYASTGQLTRATMQLPSAGARTPNASTQANVTAASSDQTSQGSATSTADGTMAQAVKALLDANPSESTADVALTLLKNSAAAQAAAKAKTDTLDAKSNGPSATQAASTANPNAPTQSDSVAS